MKKVVRLAAHMNLEAISEDDRLNVISGLFVETVQEMGGEAPSRGRVYDGMISILLTPSDLPPPEDRRAQIEGHRTGLRELLGTSHAEVSCRWKLFWPDGSIRAESESPVSWYSDPDEKRGRSERALSYPADRSPMREANPGDILVLATRLDHEGLEAFLLPSHGPFSLQILGALKPGEEGVKVPDEIEEFVREALHRRL
jgi:hypothetical protein